MPVNITSKDEVYDNEFWDNIYSKDAVPWSDAPANFLKQFVKHLEPKYKILDLGCGRGRNSIYLNKLGFDVTGLDLSKEAIDQAKKIDSTCKFHQFDLMEQEWPRGFDAIIDFGFYHFIPNDKRQVYIENLLKSLNSNGIYCQQSGRNDLEHTYNRIPGEYIPPELDEAEILLTKYFDTISLEEITLPPHGQWKKYPCWNLIAKKK